MTDREIVARVREGVRDWDFRSDERGMIAADLRALCDAVTRLTAENERLERERDQAIADEKLAVANADRMTDEVMALTAENERVREDAKRLDALERTVMREYAVDQFDGYEPYVQAYVDFPWREKVNDGEAVEVSLREALDAAMRPTTGGTDAE